MTYQYRGVDFESLMSGNDEIAGLQAVAAAHPVSQFTVGNGRWQARVAIDFSGEALAEFLAPNYSVTPCNDSLVSAYFFTDPALFVRAQEIWDSIAPCGAPEDLQIVELGDGRRLIGGRYPLRCEASRILCLADGETRWVFIKGESVARRFDAARAVRALLAGRALACGAVAVHGACIAIGERGYLLCGPKWAGKTTNLLAALQAIPSARFVSNDRVYLYPQQGELWASGSPHSIPIRVGTLRKFPRLTDALSSNHMVRAGAQRGYGEALDLSTNFAQNEAELYLSSAELTAAFGTAETPHVSLRGVIALQPRGAKPAGWARLDSDECINVLRKNLHTRIETNFAFWDHVFLENKIAPLCMPTGDLNLALWGLNSWSNLSRVWRSAPIADQ